MKKDSDHIYYGTISASEVRASSTADTPLASAAPERMPVELSASAREHQATLDAFQLQRVARSAPAPTSDQDVKKRLRDYDEPICLFGEGVC